jgi:hypothetical protein
VAGPRRRNPHGLARLAAKPTSAPILVSLGFRPVAQITRLIDRI